MGRREYLCNKRKKLNLNLKIKIKSQGKKLSTYMRLRTEEKDGIMYRKKGKQEKSLVTD